jgi:hypothetical protein
MVPQGMGFECSAIRHYGRSTDQAIGIAWKNHKIEARFAADGCHQSSKLLFIDNRRVRSAPRTRR